MTSFRTIKDLGPLLGQLAGKRVLVRADLNVPMSNGEITDDSRIRAALPTIRALLGKRARVLILAHFGRPKGEVVKDMSLAPVRGALELLLGEPVTMLAGCTDSEIGAQLEATEARVILLENTRFHAGESTNDGALAADMAALGDAFVLDALSVAHRAHASVVGIAERLPSAAGLALAADLTALESALGNPERPLAAVVGGAKVSTKLDVLTHLVEQVDDLIIGGAMANTFLYALGRPVGASLCEKDMADTALEIINLGQSDGHKVHLPTDVVVATELRAGAEARSIPVDAVGDGDMILDVGPDTVSALKAVIRGSKTLIWNGPLGAFEFPPFDAATNALATEAARLTSEGKLKTIAGGGDTLAALIQAGVSAEGQNSFSHVISAGGAFLEWMEGKELPGVAALKQE